MRVIPFGTLALVVGLAACQSDPARDALTPPSPRLDLHVTGAIGPRQPAPPGFVEVRRAIFQETKKPHGCSGHGIGSRPGETAGYVIEQNPATCRVLVAYGHYTTNNASPSTGCADMVSGCGNDQRVHEADHHWRCDG